MARTFVRHEQIASSLTSIGGYVDNTAPGAAMESGAGDLLDDLNNIRSILSEHNDNQTGNWYDEITAPTGFENASIRGIQGISQDLHNLERKRKLRWRKNLVTVTVGGSDNFVVLGVGELPGNTTAAVGAVTTLGTVVAFHAGTFGTTHSLDEVAGLTAIFPQNFVLITDATTRDPILSSGRTIYGLLQSEVNTDGHTINTTTQEVQISFVRLNATGDDLEAVPASDIQGQTINYTYVERAANEDMNEQDSLTIVNADIPAATTVTRQVAYTGQGTTPVDLVTNATLDLEGAGLSWIIRDDAEANLFSIVEGSAGGTSQFNIHTDVDEFDVDAIVNNFSAGITMASGGSPIAVGVTAGVVEATSGDLRLLASGEMRLDDGNQTGSTWADTLGIKLSDTTAEWDNFELAFGEVSLLNAITQAKNTQLRTKVQARLTADVAADADVNGPGTPHNNTDVDLAPFDSVPTSFVADVEVILNGEVLRSGANAAANEDVYPGGDANAGDLRFEFALEGTSAKPDQITVIVHGQ